MKRSISQKLTLYIAVAIILPVMCSCSFFRKNAVLTAAVDFGVTLSQGDASDILRKTDGLSRDYKKVIKRILGPDELLEEGNIYVSRMLGSIVTEVDASSAEIKKDTASVDMSFTITDHNALMDGDYKDISELSEAVDNGKTRTVEINVKFIRIDKEWYVTNFDDDGFKDLLSFAVTPMPPIGRSALLNSAKAVAESVINDDPSLALRACPF